MSAAPSYALITGEEEFERLCERLIADGRPFGFDIETSYDGEPREGAALHPEENFITGLSLTNSLAWARYAPLRHDQGANLDNYRCALALWKLLATGLGVAHGAKFELRCISRWFLEFLGSHPELGELVTSTRGYFPLRSCSMLESYVEAANRSHGLKDITKGNFGHQMTEIMELFPKNLTKREQKSIRFSELDQTDPKVVNYACEDSLWCLAHHLRRYPQVQGSFIYQLEMSVLPVVCAMEDEGVLYDWNFMREGAHRARGFLEKLQTVVGDMLTEMVRARDPASPPVAINLGSPAQISKVLYDDCGLKTRRRSRNTGKMSTDKIALKGLSDQYPAVSRILNWKSLKKLLGTYLETYEAKYSYAADGRTHPSHLQHGVPAGRFAVADPPYQQSPKKYHYELPTGETFDFNFRDGIISPPGWYILGFDYSQIELRVLAGEAGETALIEAFARGEDVHSKTAALMLGKPMAEVTPDDRAIGKTMNFALAYQMGVDGLADRLGITKDEAQGLFDTYFAAYPRIKSYLERIVSGAKARGYITTKFGRVVRIWEFESAERYVYSEGERLAGNAPIQGAGTGDYPKIAMVRAAAALRAAGLHDKVRLVMNIHDALEFYVRDDVAPAVVIRCLQPAVVFPVEGWPPMVAEWHAGRRWGSVQDLEITPEGELRVRGSKAAEPVSGDVDGDEEILAEPFRPPVVSSPVRGYVPQSPAQPQLPDVAPEWTDVGPTEGGVTFSRPDPMPAVNGAEHGRKVLITISQLPTESAFALLTRRLRERPGSSEVVLSTPQDQYPLGVSQLSPADEPEVSLILGGAMVTWDLDSVDHQALVGDLDL